MFFNFELVTRSVIFYFSSFTLHMKSYIENEMFYSASQKTKQKKKGAKI